LDLSAKDTQWKSIPQPFRRRALVAASFKGKVYVIGGFLPDDEPSLQVDIYDPAANNWTIGPNLPGENENGFGPAACTDGENLYASVADGSLSRLTLSGEGWDKVSTTTPRIVHRMVTHASEILILGGAAKKKQLNLIEPVTIGTPSADLAGAVRVQP
jgi:hypothetical protein